jgi:hypothetical protein
MNMEVLTPTAGRKLTHVEFLHRPGERELAARFFDLLGCETVDRGGHWFTAMVEPSGERDFSNNVFYASEVGECQWALEQEMAALPTLDSYKQSMRNEPQMSGHYGFRVRALEDLEAIVERVNAAGEDDPEFAGRVAVAGVYRPDDAGAVAPNMVQAFVWTDIVATGLLLLGQLVEVQWHLP